MNTDGLNFSDSVMPHSIEAEQSVIGSVIADPAVISEVMELIKPEYFYSEQHQAIYSAMVRMYTSNQPVDVVTILNEMQQMHIFSSQEDGKRYLTEIANILPTTANVKSYCKIVADKYLIRSLAFVSRSVLDEIQSGETDAQLLLDTAEQRIYDIRQGRDIRG